MGKYSAHKQVALAYFKAIQTCDIDNLTETLSAYVSEDYEMRSVYPFREMFGAKEAVEKVWIPMRSAITSMYRRQDIFMAGDNMYADEVWVMSMGHFTGLLDGEWLGIRPTAKMINVRYCEFICVEGDKITKSCLHLDLLGVMDQAGCYPLPPSTAQYYVYPGPVNHNGILLDDADPKKTEETLALVSQMCLDLNADNDKDMAQGISTDFDANIDEYIAYGTEIYSRTWVDNLTWYGPCGIGAVYTMPRYMMQHCAPFSAGLRDMQFVSHKVRFAEGDFACWFGWPNLRNRGRGGFLGLPESASEAGMYVVDVYSCTEGEIEENWVFIDLPYWLKQQGLDVFERTSTIMNPKKKHMK